MDVAMLRLVVAVTLALAVVLLVRRPLRALSGAGPAYAVWLLVPLTLLAACLPAWWVGIAPATASVPGWTMATLAPVQARVAAAASRDMHLLAWLWVAGLAFRLLLGLERARRLRSSMQPMSLRQAAEWRLRLRRLQPHGRLPPTVLHACGPALFGALRPRLLLPRDFDACFPDTHGELVLRHELVHHRRRDGLWNMLAEALVTLLWWHPLAWLAVRRYRLDQELACDAAVLASHAGQRLDYGRALLAAQVGGPLFAASHWLRESSLKERMHMIGRHETSMIRRRAGALLVGLGIAAVAVAAPHATAASVGQSAAGHVAEAGVVPAHPLARVSQVKPVYPADAVKAGQSGTVVVRVQVGVDGRAHQVRLMGDKPVYPALAQSAIDYVRQMRFQPAMKRGEPVASWVRVPVTYALGDMPAAAR